MLCHTVQTESGHARSQHPKPQHWAHIFSPLLKANDILRKDIKKQSCIKGIRNAYVTEQPNIEDLMCAGMSSGPAWKQKQLVVSKLNTTRHSAPKLPQTKPPVECCIVPSMVCLQRAFFPCIEKEQDGHEKWHFHWWKKATLVREIWTE